MMRKYEEDRFYVLEKQGSIFADQQIKIIVDSLTGVNYLYIQQGYSGGLTPLLDENGDPVITKEPRYRY